MPHGQAVGEDNQGDQEGYDKVDGLGEDNNLPAAEPVREGSGYKADQQQRGHAVETDKRHLPGRVGQFQDQPAGHDDFHPHELPPEGVTGQQPAIVGVVQRREGAVKSGWGFGGSFGSLGHGRFS